MMHIDEQTDDADTVPAVDAVIGYLADEPADPVPARGPSSEAHAVRLYDARTVYRPFSLERNGFELVHWPVALHGPGGVESFAAQAADFIASRIGADRVAALGTLVRGPAEPAGLEPRVAHVAASAENADDMALRMYRERFPDGPGFTRAVTLAFWRPLSAPPQDWPLALCDARSLPDADGVPVRCDPDAAVAGGTWFPFRPTHRWYFYPDMTEHEVLVSVVHDTDRSRPWRVARAAFLDARVDAATPRRNVEVRVIAYLR